VTSKVICILYFSTYKEDQSLTTKDNTKFTKTENFILNKKRASQAPHPT